MKFSEALENNRQKILKAWFEETIRTYPQDTARMLLRAKDPFTNPIGSMTMESLNAVFKTLAEPVDPEAIETALDPVIRIRAVQGFSASDAVGFVFFLKEIVRKQVGYPLEEAFDRRVDQIGLAAFNRFMKCREQIFLLKATESKRRIHRAFERAGLVKELSEEELLGSKKS